MRLRYLIIASPGGDADGALASELIARISLPLVHRSKEILLFATDARDVLIFSHGEGIVIGKLFHRHGFPEQIKELDEEEQRAVSMTSGRCLVERYWGSYAAAVLSGHKLHIIRDPSGGLPCYYASFGRFTAFSSDASLLVDSGFVSPSVDWNVVGRVLYLHQLPPDRMAISGISQILAGCCLAISSESTSISQIWSPWDHIQSNGNAGNSSEGLERIVRSTHSAWGSCYSKLLVGLSGGLDSSIVATCLSGGNARITCLTMTTSDPLGDEREYAREVCKAIAAELLEEPYAGEVIDLDRSVAEHIPFPCGKAHERAYNLVVRRAVERLEADAFFVGAGGDNVFYMTHSARPIVDRFLAHGLSRGAISTLRDICAITGASAMEVGLEALRLYRNRNSGRQWRSVPAYLHQDVIAHERMRPITHPWLSPPDHVPLGKLGHITMLLRAMNHIEHRDKAMQVAMISPLLSQPVVEYCLSIPSWESCEGGVDRAVARQAFATALPAKVANRRGKGSPDGFVAGFIDRNRSNIAERLLDGHLVRHKLVDPDAIAHVLRPDVALSDSDCPRLMALLDTEAWVNHWSSLEPCEPVLVSH